MQWLKTCFIERNLLEYFVKKHILHSLVLGRVRGETKCHSLFWEEI